MLFMIVVFIITWAIPIFIMWMLYLVYKKQEQKEKEKEMFDRTRKAG